MSDAEKWYTVAIVLDRIFFAGFFIALTFLYIYTFPDPLGLFELWSHQTILGLAIHQVSQKYIWIVVITPFVDNIFERSKYTNKITLHAFKKLRHFWGTSVRMYLGYLLHYKGYLFKSMVTVNVNRQRVFFRMVWGLNMAYPSDLGVDVFMGVFMGVANTYTIYTSLQLKEDY